MNQDDEKVIIEDEKKEEPLKPQLNFYQASENEASNDNLQNNKDNDIDGVNESEEIIFT